MTRPKLVPVLAALGLLLPLAGCFGSDDAPEPEPSATAATSLPATAWRSVSRTRVEQGGTLTLPMAAFPGNFNPYVGAGNPTIHDPFQPTQGSAVAIEPDGNWRVDHDYASSIKASGGKQLVVDVVLNADAVWSDGRPIVAADMISWWRAMRSSNEDFDVLSSAGFDDIAGVKQGKNRFSYTVTFKRRITDWPLYVYPGLPASVTGSAKEFNTGYRDRPVPSNGPFVIKAVDRAAGVITEAPNPRWWGARPRLSTIRYRVIAPTRQAQAFADKQLDALDLGLDEPSYRIARTRADARIERSAGLDWTQLTFNGSRGPLRDVRVRRAIARAIDRKAMAAQVSEPVGAPPVTQGSMVYVPGQKGYRDLATPVIGYDPPSSLALLRAAGYVRDASGRQVKDGKPLALTITVPADRAASRQRAQAIVNYVKVVGITLTIRTVPPATFFDRYVVPLNFELVTFGWPNAILPVSATQPLFNPVDSGQNYTGITSGKLAGLWDKANAEPDVSKRIPLAHAVDRELFAYVPIVPIAAVPVVVAVDKTLANYGAAQFETPDFTAVGFTK